MGLLLPAMSKSRDTAQTTQCRSNLRQLAIGSTAFAAERDGQFCTGPFDNRRNRGYGPVDTTGWVADMILGGYGDPGRMLCPTNPAQHCQNLALNRLNNNGFKTFSQEDQANLIRRGFNSNYTQSWYMGYTGVTNNRDLGLARQDTRTTVGPLNMKYLSKVSPSLVPLFGDGKTLADGDQFQDFSQAGKLVRAVKHLTDGPYPSERGVHDRQEYDDWGPGHGKGGRTLTGTGDDRIIGNISFADGHVESFRDDKVHDGEFGLQDINGQVVYDELEGKVFGGWLNQSGLDR